MKQPKGTSELIAPYGGVLIDLIESNDSSTRPSIPAGLRSIKLTPREVCDLELLATGGFSPLDRFMGSADLESVISDMRLADGTLFPIPVTLSVVDSDEIKVGENVALCDGRGDFFGIITVDEVYEWDRTKFLNALVGSDDSAHPLVAESVNWGKYFVSGPIKITSLPKHYDFVSLRKTPAQTRRELEKLGSSSVVAFQTRNPVHRAHEAIMKAAMERVGGNLLIHPTVGVTKPGDIDHYTRVRSYEVVVNEYFDASRTALSILPLAMRMAGPREALWHMIIRRNFGASHFLIGREHASPGLDSNGKRFFEPEAAVELAKRHSDEIGVAVVDFEEMVYDPGEKRYVERSEIGNPSFFSLSGTQVREDYLGKGIDLPEWFTRPEVATLLKAAYPPKKNQGFCIWFTGLSGAGKSTIADILNVRLAENGRRVTLLDGDLVRLHLSKGLGFSRADRDANVKRIGFVASEVVRHGGVAICAAISPYRETRNEVRKMFSDDAFIEVFVDTPLEICEQRDKKGLYAAARNGKLPGFTGIDDPYQPPSSPELVINTVEQTAQAAADAILDKIKSLGFLA